MAKSKHLATIWQLPDEVWAELQLLLPPEKPPGTPGRPAVAFRKVLNGILYVLRTGCQGTPLKLRPSRDSGWKAVPKEFGSGSTCHKRFQEWERRSVFAQLWEKLLERYDQLQGIKWHFQALDSITIKAPLGGQRRVRTPRIAGNRAPNDTS